MKGKKRGAAAARREAERQARRELEIAALEAVGGRRADIAAALRRGETYSDIARALGISRERVRQIVALAVTGGTRSLPVSTYRRSGQP